MKIGSAIKSIRKRLGIPQWELAEKCELSQTSLSQIENDIKKPHPKTVGRICDALEIPESIIYIIAMEDIDVPSNKKDIYKLVYPSIKTLALQMINADNLAVAEIE